MGLIRCKNGHLFSEKKHGNICPYCNVTVNKNGSYEEDPQGKYSDIVYLNDLEVLKPVMGWLVCLKGSSCGRDYRIIAEKNFMGRANDMEIRIIGDDTICLRNHAIIVYDPEKNRTMLLPGDSQGLYIYWMIVENGKRYLSHMNLKQETVLNLDRVNLFLSHCVGKIMVLYLTGKILKKLENNYRTA